MELLTGRRSMDKSRPSREQCLVEWARSSLKEPRRLGRIMDPRLEGQYSEIGAIKVAALAYQCLSHRPKFRPTMSTVVKTLEPLKDFDATSAGPFVYTVSVQSDEPKEDQKEDKAPKASKSPNYRSNYLHKGHRL